MPPRASHKKKSQDVLGTRALNRALLARQFLLRRRKLAVADAIEHLVGLQAQNPPTPYYGLWTRLAGFRPDDLSQMIGDRRAVRLALMRSTIHLVTARDCLTLRPLLRPVLERNLYTGSPFGRNVAGMDVAALLAAARALLEEKPRAMSALGTLLRERFPERDGASLAYAIRALLPLVQVPPRGMWGGSGQPTCTTAESWLGRPLDAEPSLDALVLRYLGAFGPATIKDVQTWSGLTKLRPVLDRLRPRLRTFHDEKDNELFDLPDAPRPDADTAAPPRFLPEYDNFFLSHADRSRVITDEHRRRVITENGMRAPLLVDGFVSGTWKIARDDGALLIEMFGPLRARERTALAEEGQRLLAFSAPDAPARDVRITVAS
jgi:hypothetical protein